MIDGQVSRCPVQVRSDDLVDPTLYSDGRADEAWRRLRGLDGLAWQQVDDQRGFWSAARLAGGALGPPTHGTSPPGGGPLPALPGPAPPPGGPQRAVPAPPRPT